MRKVRVFLALAVLVAGSSLAYRLRADSGVRGISMVPSLRHPLYREGEVIVKFREGLDRVTEEKVLRAGGAVRAERSAFGPRYKATLEKGLGVAEAVSRYRSMPEVEYSTPNGLVHALFTPNDTFFATRQWNFRLIHAERMWDIQTGDPSVVVAVVDTGIAYEDFGAFAKAPDWGATTFVQGFNVFTGTSHANDDNGHGTNVASIVAEATNNAIGYAGIAFNCALMPVKVLDASGSGDDMGVAEGIDYATNFSLNGAHPVKVINLSLGANTDDQTIDAAIDRAISAGITVVAAAGNDGKGVVGFPAAHARVIAVGAVDQNKNLTAYSDFGPEISVVAPGGSGNQTDDVNGFIFSQNFDVFTPNFTAFTYDIGFAGTSQATPHVAAVAALLIQQGITDPAAVRASIESTAEHLGTAGARNDQYGHGLVRPDLALAGLGLNQ